MTSRRTFIRNSGLLALAVPFSKAPVDQLFSRQLPAYGIQLYMVRDAMEKDPAGTLKQLGRMGYTQIESYSGSKGVYWGMSNTEFKKTAAGYGLTLISTHYHEDTPVEQQAAQGAEAGMKYLICPWKGPQKSIDDFKRIAEEFNRNGEICKKHGLRFGYHPHDYPYKPVDGQLPIDVMLANTDKDLVYYEMDFFYPVSEGKDPEAYLKKYPGRFKLSHMRDVMKEPLPEGNKDEAAIDLGKGIINYPHLLNVALNNGMEYFFVEQSRYDHETQLESAQVNAGYMKRLRLG